jgi:light-harvesting protein B-800-850 alpha chain
MNQARIWTVVNPSVGLPALLGGVTVIVLLVHFAVLTNTSWVSAFYSGKTAAAAAPVAAPAAPAVKK